MAFADASELPGGERLRTDVCVIGAGPAGIALARELDRASVDVLLLEGGDFERDPALQDLYAGPQTGLPYFPLDTTRVRQFGGASNHWEGYCRPFDPEDFVPSAIRPGVGWPFDRSEIEEDYAAAAVLCEIEPGLDYDARPWASTAGHELLSLEGTLLRNEVLLLSPPTRFGETYRDDLESRRNVRGFVRANVVELIAEASVVRSARVRQLDGREQLVDAEVFVVATGGIEVPRLLLASDGHVSGGLGNGHDLVGRFFMEHPHLRGMTVVGTADEDVGFYTAEVDARGQRVRGIMTIPAEDREEAGIGNAAILLVQRNPGSGEQPEHVHAVQSLLGSLTSVQPDGAYHLQVIAEQVPNANSRVSLSDQRDALGMRRASLHWELHPSDHRTLRSVVRLAARSFDQIGFGRVSSHYYDGSGAYSLAGGHHHMGATRMHEDPAQGVVDANSRVHGTENLYVASGSVFPSGGFANPTLTVVALALRLGRYLAGGP